MKPNSNKIVSFVKFISTDVGNFYSLSVSFMQQDMIQQGMSPSQINHRPNTSPSTHDMSPHTTFKGGENFDMYEDGSSVMG